MKHERGLIIRYSLLLLLLAAFGWFCAESPPETRQSRSESFRFRHHFIQQKLEGDAWGQTSLADVDRDGDLDFVLGRRNGLILWYEYSPPGSWHRHLIGERSPSDVGGLMLDVDGDGWLDMVAGGTWYKNPGHKTARIRLEQVCDSELHAVPDEVAAYVGGVKRPRL